VRYAYASLALPMKAYELDLRTGERRRAEGPIPVPTYDSSRYRSEACGHRRATASASRVDRLPARPRKRGGGRAAPVDGYGAYGYSNDPKL